MLRPVVLDDATGSVRGLVPSAINPVDVLSVMSSPLPGDTLNMSTLGTGEFAFASTGKIPAGYPKVGMIFDMEGFGSYNTSATGNQEAKVYVKPAAAAFSASNRVARSGQLNAILSTAANSLYYFKTQLSVISVTETAVVLGNASKLDFVSQGSGQSTGFMAGSDPAMFSTITIDPRVDNFVHLADVLGGSGTNNNTLRFFVLRAYTIIGGGAMAGTLGGVKRTAYGSAAATATVSGVHQLTAGVKRVFYRAYQGGAGGGSGGISASGTAASGGAGAAGGAYSEGWIDAADLPANLQLAYNVGVGGAGGASRVQGSAGDGNAGSAGGNTFIGASNGQYGLGFNAMPGAGGAGRNGATAASAGTSTQAYGFYSLSAAGQASNAGGGAGSAGNAPPNSGRSGAGGASGGGVNTAPASSSGATGGAVGPNAGGSPGAANSGNSANPGTDGTANTPTAASPSYGGGGGGGGGGSTTAAAGTGGAGGFPGGGGGGGGATITSAPAGSGAGGKGGNGWLEIVEHF